MGFANLRCVIARPARMGLLLVGAAALVFAASVSANAATLYSNGFETDISGWSTADPYGSTTRVASGTGGISAYQGGYFAYVNNSTPSGANATDTTGPYTNFGGYSSVFPGTYTASIAIYLDPSWAAGSGFDWSVASNGSDGNYQRDFIFHVSNSSPGGALRVSASNNSSDGNIATLTSTDTMISSAGWYLFQQTFYNDGGVLAVDMNVLDSSMTSLFSQTLSDPADTIPGEVGGNRYGWFTLVDVAGNGLAVDAATLNTTPLPAGLPLFLGGLGVLGFFASRRRGKRTAAVAA